MSTIIKLKECMPVRVQLTSWMKSRKSTRKILETYGENLKMPVENLATEILHELKAESRRRFILLIVTISLLFVSNVAWLIAWNLPNKEVTESYDLSGEDSANVIYNQMGDVDVNGQNQSDKEN